MKKITKDELEIMGDASKQVFFESDYRFLREHNGLRPGRMHLFLGVPGGGKSTLARSLLLDILKNKATTMIWLSEETESEFVTELSKAGISVDIINSLKIFSELDLEESSLRNLRCFVNEFIKEHEPEILLFDNITTSHLYIDKKPNEQSAAAKWLKTICANVMIPFVIFAHTSSEVHDNMSRMVNENDIRGSRTIINLVQFLYIIQRFSLGDFIFTTIRVLKHRGQDVENRFFKLFFKKELRIFTMDFKLSFKEFKDIWKERNRL